MNWPLRLICAAVVLNMLGSFGLAQAPAQTLQVEPTPLVLRTSGAPSRQILVRIVSEGKPRAAEGTLHVSFGEHSEMISLKASDFSRDIYPLSIPEPDAPRELLLTMERPGTPSIEARCEVRPARHWTVYLTPRTHYDIGYTDPQPVVIERLSKDMDTAVRYCEETWDVPEESQFRWTVEVSGLLKNFIARHSETDIARLVDWVRKGRIEICGFSLNMPTETLGHEELIRCLYNVRELRQKYGITIETAILDDVPGYTWALPGILHEAGIPRATFCANLIRGQLRWDGTGGLRRPFYWMGPDDQRIFVWFSNHYGDGNFFRERGLKEADMLKTLQTNAAAGYPFDLLELGVSMDNQPPELNVVRNARDWNRKYLWPKVIVATCGQFLRQMETTCGPECAVYRGDMPSWWADGPPSAALENGAVRRLHDELTAAEALWTLNSLANPRVKYPRKDLRAAYDQMLLFDEHTWGARGTASHPKEEGTVAQWKWKANYAHEAVRRGQALYQAGLAQVSRRIPSPGGRAIAVWNLLAWPRSDVVALPLEGTDVNAQAGLRVRDVRSQQEVPVQLSDDSRTAVFVATNVPSMGYAVFAVEAGTAAMEQPKPAESSSIENEFYRIAVVPQKGGLSSIYDKQLGRELLDSGADYLANQAIYERSLDGRDAITAKKPSRFDRQVPSDGRLVSRTAGPVYQEMVLECSLPTMPSILQRIRLYNDLKLVELSNTIRKEENFSPEGTYFAFPFGVPSSQMRVQIADAVMRPGKDQLPTSCQDYYAIQQWLDVAGQGYGIILASLDAPQVTLGGLNTYQWADQVDFSKAHVFSWIMNNCWYTNFPAGQSGTMPFRYRITSYDGGYGAVRSTQWGWQPFYPLAPVWLSPEQDAGSPPPASFVQVEGDPVIVSCIKTAEASDDVIVRLLELRGREARTTLHFTPPDGTRIARAYRADVLEEPQETLQVSEDTVTVTVPANRVVTVGVVIAAKP